MTRHPTLLVTGLCALALAASGCAYTPRETPPGMSIYTEGGYFTPFYAEVVYAAKEGQRPRVFLFGKIEHFEHFLKEKEVPENQHKKYIGRGKDRMTVVVRDVVGYELRENPQYTEKLLAKHRARHGLTDQPSAQ